MNCKDRDRSRSTWRVYNMGVTNAPALSTGVSARSKLGGN